MLIRYYSTCQKTFLTSKHFRALVLLEVFASFVTMLVTKVSVVVTIMLLSPLWTHQVCGSNTKLLLLYGRRVTCRAWIHREGSVQSEKNSFTYIIQVSSTSVYMPHGWNQMLLFYFNLTPKRSVLTGGCNSVFTLLSSFSPVTLVSVWSPGQTQSSFSASGAAK